MKHSENTSLPMADLDHSLGSAKNFLAPLHRIKILSHGSCYT